MQTEHIDGGVRDKAHAQDILDAIRPQLPTGARVRITPKLVKVDLSDAMPYTTIVAELVKVGVHAPPN